MTSPQAPSPDALPGRGWLFLGAAVSLLAGVFAIVSPLVFGYFLTQLLGALCLVSGAVTLFQAVFVRHRPHRFLSLVSGAIRVAAGAALFFYTVAGLAAVTLVLAVVFFAEGIVCLATSLRMRENPAWVWLFLNGWAALLLGWMVYLKWPLDAEWVVGLLYGIQSLFLGGAMAMLAIKHRAS